MRLAYFHYGLGEARIIAYHKELLDIQASIDGIDQAVPFQAFAPIFHVSPAVGMKNVTLTASKNGEILGTCICQFNKGLHISEPTGLFDGISAPVALIAKETVRAHKRKNLVQELPPTDVMLLSQVYDGWESNKEFSMNVKATHGRVRITGYSATNDQIAGLRAGLVLILTGEQAGHMGFALWSKEDGGIQLSGGEGAGTPWKFYEDISVFPKKVQAIVGLPPVAVMEKTKKNVEEGSDIPG